MELDERIEIVKALILEDMSKNIIPKTVKSFRELHDYVDANEYLPIGIPDIKFELFTENNNGEIINSEWTDIANQIMDGIDEWLKNNTIKEVKENKTNKCPHCKNTLNPDEGSSVMYENNICVITCPYCGKEYFYIANDKSRTSKHAK